MRRCSHISGGSVMRAKKPVSRVKAAKAGKLPVKVTVLSRLVGLASHAAMGAAIGLAFAFIATLSPTFGVMPVLAEMTAPDFRVFDFAITCACGFGIVTTVTGLALSLEDDK
jgi:hypothetical protein